VIDRKFREELQKSIMKNALLPAFHGLNVSTHMEFNRRKNQYYEAA